MTADVTPGWPVFVLALAFAFVGFAHVRWILQYLRAQLGDFKERVIQLFADNRKPAKRPVRAPGSPRSRG